MGTYIITESSLGNCKLIEKTKTNTDTLNITHLHKQHQSSRCKKFKVKVEVEVNCGVKYILDVRIQQSNLTDYKSQNLCLSVCLKGLTLHYYDLKIKSSNAPQGHYRIVLYRIVSAFADE